MTQLSKCAFCLLLFAGCQDPPLKSSCTVAELTPLSVTQKRRIGCRTVYSRPKLVWGRDEFHDFNRDFDTWRKERGEG